MILVMFGSVFGIIVNSLGGQQQDTTSIKYNGFEFQNINDYWSLTVENFSFVFKYNPEEISNLSVSTSNLSYINSYSGKPLYIYSDSSDASLEIYRNFQNIAERMQPACFEKDKCQDSWPLKDCTSNFIIIQESQTTKISQENGCVFIEGNSEELTQLTDDFLYKTLGIKQ